MRVFRDRDLEARVDAIELALVPMIDALRVLMEREKGRTDQIEQVQDIAIRLENLVGTSMPTVQYEGELYHR